MTSSIEGSPPRFETRLLTPGESPDLVFFSSVSENTRRFIERLGRPAVRIPLRPRRDGMIRVCRPFVLVVPTYGGGERSGAVPKQVIAFLNDPPNRALIRGVITAGNTNFGEHYCLAGPVISAKCRCLSSTGSSCWAPTTTCSGCAQDSASSGPGNPSTTP
ncbi:MAG: class Ib ribonucleoside-diphosphate reductase assembly flavoprotein NrdI [Arachnia sp.]